MHVLRNGNGVCALERDIGRDEVGDSDMLTILLAKIIIIFLSSA